MVTAADPHAAELALYDFRRPLEALPGTGLLDAAHERLAACWVERLARAVRRTVRARPLAVAETSQSRLLDELPPGTLAAVCRAGDEAESMLLAIPAPLLALAVDCLLGGPGVAPAAPREPSPLELAIFAPALVGLAADVLLACRGAAPAVRVEAAVTNLRQLERRPEALIVLDTELQVGDFRGRVLAALPRAWIALDPEPAAPLEPAEPMAGWVEYLDVTVRLCLGEVELSVEELMQLQAGDVLAFPVAVSEPVTLWVEDQPAFRARVGRRGRRLAARITAPIPPTEYAGGNVP